MWQSCVKQKGFYLDEAHRDKFLGVNTILPYNFNKISYSEPVAVGRSSLNFIFGDIQYNYVN